MQKGQNIPVENNGKYIEKGPTESNLTHLIFIIIYLVFLGVVINSSTNANYELFIDWEKISPILILRLVAAISFSFFLPGYALVMVVDKKFRLTLLPKLLLAYLFSILITGLGGYISASLGNAITSTGVFFIITYILIFLLCLQRINALRTGFYRLPTFLLYRSSSKIKESLMRNCSQYIVFSSLFALVILYTYYLNDGKIVVDQWYHHGRAILMGSDLFRELGPYDVWNPPFFSAFLASFFNLSGSPSVNAYAAIGFLNIVPVFAFYYFLTNWIPKKKQRAALLATTLFMLSSGFGWVYAINSAINDHQQVTFDESSSVNILVDTARKTFDIGTPTTFIGVGHPDVTTPLILFALPAGFTLLGLILEVKLYQSKHLGDNPTFRSKARYSGMLACMAIITGISFLGILAHDEFYLFIITASIAIVVLIKRQSTDLNYSVFFVALLVSIFLVILLDASFSPLKFYTTRTIILDMPLIIICFLFVSLCWAFYLTLRKIKFSNKLDGYQLKEKFKKIIQLTLLERITRIEFLNDHQIRFLKLSLGIVMVSVVAYFYLFTTLVWDELSVDQINSQIKPFSNVPWYLYPIKFGLTGLLGVAYLLSYLFKKFEREIFIFGVIAIVAFFAGPYYDEHRFGKYIMAGMAAFAALLIYQIISSHTMEHKLRLSPLIVGIVLGLVVTSSGLSIFIYAGYVELFTARSDWIESGRRDFPTTSEIQLLKFLNSKIINSKAHNIAHNIAVLEKESTNELGFVTKIYGFTPIPREKLLQSPLTLNSSTLEGIYKLLNSSDTRYILIPKNDNVNYIEKESVIHSSFNTGDGNIPHAVSFLLDNFPRVYEDENYTVLEVLPLAPPSPNGGDVAFVYQRDFHELRLISNKSHVLQTNSGLFGLHTQESRIANDTSYNNNSLINKIEGQTKTLLTTAAPLILGTNISADKSKNMTLWSHPVWKVQRHNYTNYDENNITKMNYIEANFKIIDNIVGENKSEMKEDDKFGAGIWWEHDNKNYRLSVSDVGLELSETPSVESLSSNQTEDLNDTNKTKQLSPLILSLNQEIKRQQGIWYNLKILLMRNNIEIYVDDILRIKVPARDYYQTSAEKNNTGHSISRVGISTYYSKSEFQPIILGQISQLQEPSYSPYQKIYYEHYYPLSILALSSLKYDSFIDGDTSAFSRKYVILPFDISLEQENEAAKYLDYVSKGGNLIVFNSDNKFDDIFSKLLSIKPGNLTKFDSIDSSDSNKIGEKKYSLNISGIAKNIEIDPNINLTVKSYYMNKDKSDNSQRVAPFAIEKNYGHGKIIFVNAIGYFDAIRANSLGRYNTNDSDKNRYFATLSKVAPIIGIPEDDLYTEKNSTHNPSLRTTGIIGDIKIFPRQDIMINSSSVMFPDSHSIGIKPVSYNLTANLLSISKNPLQNISITSHKVSNNTFTANNTDNNSKLTVDETSNGNQSSYSFRKVTIKDLKLYGGPFEIIINVINNSNPLILPTTSSYNDYIAMSIRRGFDLTINFPDNNSSYAQLDISEKGNEKDSFQRIKLSSYKHDNTAGSNNTGMIFLHDVRTDVQTTRYISTLMKSPEIKIMNVDEAKGVKESTDEETTAVSYERIYPASNPTTFQKGSGDIKIKLDHVDNFNEPHDRRVDTRFITYLKSDIQITKDDRNEIPTDGQNSWFSKLLSKKPGDISEDAKEHGIEVPWREVISSTPSIITAIAIVAVMVVVIALSRYEILKFNRE